MRMRYNNRSNLTCMYYINRYKTPTIWVPAVYICLMIVGYWVLWWLNLQSKFIFEWQRLCRKIWKVCFLSIFSRYHHYYPDSPTWWRQLEDLKFPASVSKLMLNDVCFIVYSIRELTRFWETILEYSTIQLRLYYVPVASCTQYTIWTNYKY